MAPSAPSVMGNNVCCKACKNRFVRMDDWTTNRPLFFVGLDGVASYAFNEFANAIVEPFRVDRLISGLMCTLSDVRCGNCKVRIGWKCHQCTESMDNVTTESAPDPIQIHGKFAIEANAMFRIGDDVPGDTINVPAVDAPNVPALATNTSDAPTTENNP
ncbi:hypothetical protein QJS04_geneDACA023685 [Acorus gramineus]|uniref:Yippee domain-containing protein n=1 Tax=Acorus gramineus TaxID=55184 RepID=A0AAV9B4A5_ACOGR|nr:hypothetical protein QJS04_geneDACA023685 [Acorus gramineus]